jgi:hypothetical protein
MKKIDRKTFIRTLAGGIAGGAALGVLSPEELLAASSVTATGIPAKAPLDFDVAVVGAGASGIPAAIAAARNGAKVVLLEEDWLPGGAPIDQFVTFICGAPRVGQFQKMVHQLNEQHTLSGKPVASFGKDGMDGKNHWWHPTSYLQVLSAEMAAQPNLTLMCGAMVTDVILETKGKRDTVKGVRILRGGVRQDIRAKVTIDATGMGMVSEKAGCKVLFGRESMADFGENLGLEQGDGKTQPCTWMFISQRIKADAKLPRAALKGGTVEDNLNKWVMPADQEQTDARDAGIYLHWGRTMQVTDTRDPVQLADAQQKLLAGLKPEIAALEKAGFACHLAPKMGVRECRRVEGEYVLRLQDIQQGVFPDDKVAEAWYDLDPWGMNLSKVQKVVPPYGSPYRSLIPLGVEGLLTAGRIISGTHIAASSYRVQPICSNTGEAAGTAAAMAAAANTGVRNIDIKKLQANLDGYGLFDFTKNRK